MVLMCIHFDGFYLGKVNHTASQNTHRTMGERFAVQLKTVLKLKRTMEPHIP